MVNNGKAFHLSFEHLVILILNPKTEPKRYGAQCLPTHGKLYEREVSKEVSARFELLSGWILHGVMTATCSAWEPRRISPSMVNIIALYLVLVSVLVGCGVWPSWHRINVMLLLLLLGNVQLVKFFFCILCTSYNFCNIVVASCVEKQITPMLKVIWSSSRHKKDLLCSHFYCYSHFCYNY